MLKYYIIDMATSIGIIGKRLLISESRQSVRGTMIFLFTSAMLILSLALVASATVILLALHGIYLPTQIPYWEFLL